MAARVTTGRRHRQRRTRRTAVDILPAVSAKTRRWLALALLAAAAVTVTATVLAAKDQGEHIYLRFLAYPLTGIALAVLMLAGAAELGVQRARLRTGLQVAAGLVAFAALCVQAYVLMGFSFLSPSQESVAATSADFRLVVYRSPTLFGPDTLVLRLQSREGLASREGRENLACFIAPESDLGPEWRFDRAGFTGSDEVLVSTEDGTRWRIRFNRQTLLPVNPIDRCPKTPAEPFGT